MERRYTRRKDPLTGGGSVDGGVTGPGHLRVSSWVVVGWGGEVQKERGAGVVTVDIGDSEGGDESLRRGGSQCKHGAQVV